MRKISIILLVFLVLSACTNNSSPQINDEIDQLISDMTIEEKVGQLAQIDIHFLMKNTWSKGGLDKNKLKTVIVDYGVGSILSGGGGSPDINSPKEWAEMVNEVQKMTEQTRLNIPVLYGVDAVHGHNNVKGAVIYPHNLAVASTFNVQLAEKEAALTSEELAATGINWNFAPVLDVARDPRWGRTYETFGEDPYLVSMMGKHMINGIEASGKVAATAKHFIAYSGTNNGQDRQPADISERTLREIYLPPFEAAFNAGVDTVMVNSAEVNGVPVHASKGLLTDLLRDELHFNGVILSDWEDVHKLTDYHQVSRNYKQANALAFEAGIDMSMIPMTLEDIDLLIELVTEGAISEERLDESVQRILTLKKELGLFDERYVIADEAADVFKRQETFETARELARQSIILLKNDDILPLPKDVKSILVVGPTANSISRLAGGWTIGWQGAEEHDLTTGSTVLDEIKKKVSPQTNISILTGEEERDEIMAVAKDVDVVIAVVGEKPYAEFEGNTTSLALPDGQSELLATLQSVNENVVMVTVSGRPLAIEQEASMVKGVLWTFLPGTEGGMAIADVLFGDYNPSGKLPITIPKHEGQLPTYYNDRVTATYEPLFSFGDGLSYTTFSYKDLKVSDLMNNDKTLKVSIIVKNTGAVAGDEVVLVYAQDFYQGVTPRHKQLTAFERVSLQPNEEKEVQFEIPFNQLKKYDQELQRTLPNQLFIKIDHLREEVTLR
ncbi:beta-glucosidase [Bacillus sp. HMF5848]|uniref:glycoside hydrolase family 3 N-terminal domain-containing protein n=1 Tax=Bacillus sp. HMF5848 TaxID=2495421 RepID=UPI000F78CDDE|nr:glycoside hydrolase family 3 N-terminal domain-containing protein [Bacillus sp. HMF5848]RSK27681.1 beta-glucosidase [Bacillus sp. HMF5848]